MTLFPSADHGNTGYLRSSKGKRKIKSIELDNVSRQKIKVDDMLGISDIAAQGDAMYMYVYQRIHEPPTNTLGLPIHPYPYEPQETEIDLWRVRNDEEYDPDEVRGAYVKTVVVNDVAYHFFCSHQLYR